MTVPDYTRKNLFIGGRWCAPQSLDVQHLHEAATGKPLGTTPLAGAADIDRAVHAARTAFDSGPWPTMAVSERADILRAYAAELESRGDFTAELVSRENGMPSLVSRGANVTSPVTIMNQYANLVETGILEETRPSSRGSTIVRRVPIGVVAAIVPWNFPQLIAAAKIAPALAAGCTVVVKPSPETALDAFVLADAAEAAGLPDGVLNIVPAERDVSAALVAHPGIDKVSFTGSTAAGRHIAEVCGRLVRPVTLELGGKSASIVLEDADIDVFAANLMAVSFINNGQTCVLHSRILAPRSRYDEVVEVVAAAPADLWSATLSTRTSPAARWCRKLIASASSVISGRHVNPGHVWSPVDTRPMFRDGSSSRPSSPTSIRAVASLARRCSAPFSRSFRTKTRTRPWRSRTTVSMDLRDPSGLGTKSEASPLRAESARAPLESITTRWTSVHRSGE